MFWFFFFNSAFSALRASTSSWSLSTTVCKSSAAVSVVSAPSSTVSITSLATSSTGTSGVCSSASTTSSTGSASAFASSTASSTVLSSLEVPIASAIMPLSFSQKPSLTSIVSKLVFCFDISFSFLSLFSNISSRSTQLSIEKPFLSPFFMLSHNSIESIFAAMNHVPIGQSNPYSTDLSFSLVFIQLSAR